MEVKTKFDICDSVKFTEDGKEIVGKIIKVDASRCYDVLHMEKGEVRIKYEVLVNGNDVYKLKEEEIERK